MGEPTKPAAPATVTMLDRDGDPHDVPVTDVPNAPVGWHVETSGGRDARLKREVQDDINGGVKGKVGAVIGGVLRGGTAGLSDAYYTAVGGENARKQLDTYKRLNPELSTVSEVGGALLTAIPTGGQSIGAVLPTGAAARLGANIARAGEGASAITKIGRAAAGYGTEGAILGAGSGISELALDDKPITLERAISTISSHALYGGGIGAAAGTLGKVAEIGLQKGKAAIDDVLATRAQSNVVDDLAAMDMKQLRAAEKVERETLKTGHKAEVEAIGQARKVEVEALEQTRQVEREAITDELGKFRREVREQNHALTVQNLKLPAAEGKLATSEIGKVARDANMSLDRLLRNPKDLIENQGPALKALRQQEYAWEKTLERGDELRAIFAKDASGVRMASLDSIPGALEKNRALQARIGEVRAPIPAAPAGPLVPTSSARLDAIEAAKDALTSGGKPSALGGVPQRMVEGTTFGAITGLIGKLPIPGASMAAPLLGAAVSKLVGEKVFGGLGKAAAQQAERTGKAVSSLLATATKAAPKVTQGAVPVATNVLAAVRYAAAEPKKATVAAKTDLASLYAARSSEVRALTAYGPTGEPEMRHEARAAMSERLKGVAAVNPQLADQLETLGAKRVEFLAAKLPRRPDMAGVQIGPDLWRPSDMEMRKWARYVAGVEDPGGIEERLAHGSVSVEDAEVMQKVYPERLAEITRQVMEAGATMEKRLPYKQRLAFSVLTGQPLVPAMEPRILAVLQGSFAAEAGTAGGTQAPQAQPNFGALGTVAKPQPTPAQKRSA